MANEIRQDLRLTQQLVMSPQLQLAIRLLQLSRLELVEMVHEEMETNPVLDEETETEGESIETSSSKKSDEKEIDWEAYLEDCCERPQGVNFSEDSEDSSFEATLSSKTTLIDHLLWQLHLSPFSADEIAAGEFIIGNIDEDGYLRIGDSSGDEAAYYSAVNQEIAAAAGVAVEVVAATLKKVQQFDPVGVGSRTLKECLLTQCEFLGCNDAVVREIITSHLGNLEKKNYKAIASTLKLPLESVIEAVKIVMGLNPRPGSAYGSSEANVVIPDIYIQKTGNEYVVLLNENGLPKLRVSGYYRELLARNGNKKNDETRAYVQDKLRSAVWLIKSINQRQRTIYKVAQSIVKFQREFLDKGVCHMKPLILRDVAEDIGMHESTVSRVTTSKYAHTPHGIFELKYFFSPKIGMTDKTADMATKSVMEKMREIYGAEDATKPYSDQKILEMLRGSGIDIARRTVTKYREAMGILPASGRKKLF